MLRVLSSSSQVQETIVIVDCLLLLSTHLVRFLVCCRRLFTAISPFGEIAIKTSNA